MPARHARAARLPAVVALALIPLLASPAPSSAQPLSDRPLVVGTKEAPPFAIRNADGRWSGISIDLWQDIADDLGVEFELREMELEGLLAGVESGELDAGVAAVTVTPEREAVMDFTHPFHVSGLGIAVSSERGGGWLTVVEQFFSLAFLRVVAALAALLLVVGWLVWLFERRRNPEQFGGPPAQGIGAGFWWSAVTMTTVGYGDKAPQTVGGRAVALLWMFAALIIISSFTAAITASLTVGEMRSGIEGPGDLPGARVRSVAASTSADYLARAGIGYTVSDTVPAALTALADDAADAVVYDEPMLRYETRRAFSQRVAVLPVTFERQLYAIALPPGSPLREPINRALLARTTAPDWQRQLHGYLGQER